jgi:hypothetical protein
MHSDSAVRPAGGEVQLSAYAQRVARRWYVVLLTVIVAVLLVVLNGLGHGRESKSTASVYLGQPTSTTGGAEQNPRASLNAVTQFVTSGSTLKRAAIAAGLGAGGLNGHVSVRSAQAATPIARGAPTAPIVDVVVQGPMSAAKANRAVDALGQSVIDYTNTFQRTKVQYLQANIASDKRLLRRYQQLAEQAQASINAIAKSNLSNLDKLLAIQPYQNTVFNANSRIETLTTELSDNQLDLATTRNLEASAFVARGDAHRVGPASSRSLLMIAAVAGLVVGVALALVWDALRTRAAPATA